MRRPTAILALAALALTLASPAAFAAARKLEVAIPGDNQDPPTAERTRAIENFIANAGRSIGPRSGDIFALPNKYRYIVEDSYIKARISHREGEGGKPVPYTQSGDHHGTAWDYDLRIPLLLYGPGYVKPKFIAAPATQQDIVPTVAQVLGATAPEDAAGRVLDEALVPAPKPPKVVLVLVFDQGGRSLLDEHPHAWPFIKGLKAQGAWYENARVTHIDPETIVGHTAIGTGAYPSRNGITANHPWIRQAGVARMAVQGDRGPSPSAIESPSFADVWLRQTKGKAVVIGQSLADRAAMGMVGHGALYAGNPAPICNWYNDRTGRWDTYPLAFRQPDYVKAMRPEPYWQRAGGATGAWFGHRFDNPSDFRVSPTAAEYDGDTMLAMLKNEPVGQDGIPDLVFWSIKATDYVSHFHGLESLEARSALAAADAQAKRIVQFLEQRVGKDHLLVAFSADHGGGLSPDLHGGVRMPESEVLKRINAQFDKRDNRIALAQHVTSTQIYLDDAEMRANGVTTEQVRDFVTKMQLGGKPFFAAVYTQEEILALAAKQRQPN